MGYPINPSAVKIMAFHGSLLGGQAPSASCLALQAPVGPGTWLVQKNCSSSLYFRLFFAKNSSLGLAFSKLFSKKNCCFFMFFMYFHYFIRRFSSIFQSSWLAGLQLLWRPAVPPTNVVDPGSGSCLSSIRSCPVGFNPGAPKMFSQPPKSG